MIFRSLVIFYSVFLLVTPSSSAQESNAIDSHGKRHGPWKEYYDNNMSQPKFEGQFEHGKRIGLFKFCQQGLKHPVAVMEFDPESDLVKAQFLSQSGKVISEGEMINQQHTGLWTYYHKNSEAVMMTENYREGKLHGSKKVYYDNGQLAEEAVYINGELDGNRILYSVKGVVLEDLNYSNGQLHGPARFYNGKGELMSEGEYKDNKHHGTWRYYENGKFKEEKDF